MNSKLSKFYWFCILLSITNLPLHATNQQQLKGSIIGRIIDSDKKPVYPATVSIEGTAIGEYNNEKGEYKLNNIPEGKQVLIVSGMGIKSKRTAITVIANKTTQIADIEVDNSVNLNEVAIIGKSEARRQQEQAFALTVLDLKKAQSIATPLNRLLNNVSGVRVRQDGGVGSNYNFSLNGFSGNQVKFFLDGIPMDNFGPSFNLNNISTNMAERVEIYKGVLPVSLGADALGGAVNIISRKDANYLDASYSIGSFNTHKAAINGAYTDNKTGFTVRANAFYNYSDNDYEVFAPIKDLNTNKIVDNRWVKRFHDNYQAGGIRLESGITNKAYADYLLAGIILSKNDKDVQTGATMDAVYGGVKVKSESLIPSIRYKKDDLFTEGLSVSFYGAYNSVKTFNTDTISRSYNWLGESIQDSTRGERAYTYSEIKNREWLTTTNVSYMLDTHQSITLNHVFSSMNRKIHDKVDPENESNKIPQKLTKNVTGLGWQIKYDRWNVNIFGKLYNTNSSTYKRLDEYTENARLEKVKDDKTYFGYGAATTFFILPKLQAKLSYEQAYRLPESTEMFGDGLIQQRNADLKAESSDNINLGIIYEQHLNNEHILYFETNFIYRNTKDFIHKAVSLTTDPTTGYENLGKVLTRGVEGGLKYRWKNLLHAGVNITYQSIIDNQEYEKNSGSFVGEGITENISYKERLPNIPYFFANGEAGVQFQNVIVKDSELTFDYMFDYIQKYYLSFPGLGAKASKKVIPQQISHDIALGYTLQNGKYGFVLECTNITNEKLYDNYRLQKPGRAFNFKVRYFLR